MRQRLLESVGVLVVLVVVIVLLRATVPVAGQAPTTTAWGHPNLGGIWLDVYDTPLERAPEHSDREFLTAEERAAMNQAKMGDTGRDLREGVGTAQDVSGAYNEVYTSEKPAGPRTSLVVDPPNGRIPALTPQAMEKERVQLEWRQALMRNTPTCEQGARGCEGGEYGPPSPRRFDVPPFYNTGRMNRHDGPEDQSLGDRCMAGRTPDFDGFRRIVQGEDSIAIGFDTGQGQGYQRLINLSGNHPPSSVRLRHGDSRGRWEGDTLVIETTNFNPKFPYRGSTENRKITERYTLSDAETLEYQVTVEDPMTWVGPWTVRQTLKRQSDQENRIYYEPRCSDGNYGIAAMFIGAREKEAEFAAGTGPDPFSQDSTTGGGGAR